MPPLLALTPGNILTALAVLVIFPGALWLQKLLDRKGIK